MEEEDEALSFEQLTFKFDDIEEDEEEKEREKDEKEEHEQKRKYPRCTNVSFSIFGFF